MRARDYLVGRPEVEPEEIEFTGCSGDGTLTTYVMALDDRVACALRLLPDNVPTPNRNDWATGCRVEHFWSGQSRARSIRLRVPV